MLGADEALKRLFRERPPQDFAQRLGQRVEWRSQRFTHTVHRLQRRGTIEGARSSEQLDQRHAQRELITRGGERLAADLLGRHVRVLPFPDSRARLIGWMKDCQTGRERLRAGLPPDWID